MERYVELSHSLSTWVLMGIYALLALLLFKRKKQGIGGFNKTLAQLARLALLILYFSGLFLSVTLGRVVHIVHHILSALPILALFAFRLLPERFQAESTNKTFAWLFSILAILILITALSSQLSILPKF